MGVHHNYYAWSSKSALFVINTVLNLLLGHTLLPFYRCKTDNTRGCACSDTTLVVETGPFCSLALLFNANKCTATEVTKMRSFSVVFVGICILELSCKLCFGKFVNRA